MGGVLGTKTNVLTNLVVKVTAMIHVLSGVRKDELCELLIMNSW